MTKNPALTWGLGILGALAVGGAVWYFSRQENKGDVIHRLGGIADDAREKASGVAKNLKDKATPLMSTVADLVEKNAELVSAVINVPADQVRKTGQEIRQVATTLERNLDAISKI